MTRSKLALALVVAGLTGARLWFSGQTELLPEEAYYWMYAQHPAFGYFDHPPMVAWIIRAGTHVLGHTQTGVRVVNMLLWVGTCATLFATARCWFGERVALWTAWLFVLLPVFVGAGFIVTPDGPLVFFWALTLYALTRALQSDRTRYWPLAGVALGGALLSKYYAVLLAPSLLWFLLLSPKYRGWLRRWQPWATLALGLAVFSPVILWNAQHDWASFAFQSARTISQKGSLPEKVGMFWLMQAGVLTPFGLVLFAAAAVHGVKRGWLGRDDAWNFAMSFSLPLFLLFLAASFKTEVHINWTAPAFLSLSIAGAAVFLEGTSRGWRAGAWAFGLTGLAVAALFHSSLAYGKPEPLAYSHAGGWRALAERVASARRELTQRTGQDPFIIGADRYYLASELGYYLDDPHDCVNVVAVGGRGMSFRYWTDLHQFEGRPAVIVISGQTERVLAEASEYFERLDEPVSVPVSSRGGRRGAVTLVNAYGYRRSQSLTLRRSSL